MLDLVTGQSLIDVLVGAALIVLSVGSAVVLIYGGQVILTDREHALEARALAEEGARAARLILKGGWSSVADGTYGLTATSGVWQFTTTSDIHGAFTRTITLTTVGNETRAVSSTVSWQASPTRPLAVELATLATNWRAVLETGGDTGGGGPTGNWQNPRTLGSIDVGAGNSATDVDVVGNVVFISTEASVKSKADLHAFDVTNPAAPVKLDGLDVDAYALASIDVAGGYAYGASTGVIPDLKVVNAANPSNLTFVSEYNVITFVNAKSVAKYGTTVLLGVEKTSFNGEVFTINVANPSSPSQLDVFEINGNANKIHVKDGFAYVATSRDDAELFILDVSDPSSIQQKGTWNAPGTADGTSVFVDTPSRVYVGAGNTLYILDASNPAAVTTLGSFNAGGMVNDIYAAGYLAFLATANSNSEFQVVNVTNPAAPTLHASLNFPQVATGVDYQNNLVFVSVRSNDGLRIITSQ